MLAPEHFNVPFFLVEELVFEREIVIAATEATIMKLTLIIMWLSTKVRTIWPLVHATEVKPVKSFKNQNILINFIEQIQVKISISVKLITKQWLAFLNTMELNAIGRK